MAKQQQPTGLRAIARKARNLASAKGLKRLVAGAPANPFADGGQHLIVHTAHHKVGTSWFSAIFRALAEHYEIPLAREPEQVVAGKNGFFMQHRVLAAPSSFSNYRGSHMIRDPRDVVISGFHYHLWTHEGWANKKISELPQHMKDRWTRLPIDDIGHLSYKEYLNTLSEEDGLLAEIDRASNTVVKDIVDWNYNDPAVFEFRYEDIMVNEEEILEQMFTHYGFTKASVQTACDIAAQFSFSNRTGRAVGEVDGEHHIRSGKLAQWKGEFKDSHKALFKELHGEQLIALGYAEDQDW